MKIKQINEAFSIDIGAPIPKILCNEYAVYLVFYIRKPNPDWDGRTVNVRRSIDAGIATVKFNFYQQFKFGAPNDEAIDGHPYYPLGLEPYALQELVDSDWIEALRKMNSVHTNHSDAMFEKLKHYIFFFHDSCFEIVCRNYEVVEGAAPTMKEEVERLSGLL